MLCAATSAQERTMIEKKQACSNNSFKTIQFSVSCMNHEKGVFTRDLKRMKQQQTSRSLETDNLLNDSQWESAKENRSNQR